MFKLANEGTARVYWNDDDVASIGIRPYVVYGPGRDQGLTSGPSLAMAAAARGEGHTIAYGGTAQYDYAPDVGRAFALAARAAADGAHVANFPGVPSTMQEVVDAIAKEVQAAVKTRAFADKLIQTGLEPFGSTPEEMVATIAADKHNWLAIKGDLVTATQ